MEAQANKFEGWAVVELFGHAKEIGFVTTQYFGTACLFQIDVPELPAREFVLEKPQYLQHTEDSGTIWTPAGSKVKRLASPGRSALVGPSAIYKLTPCSQATAMKALEEFCPRPLMLLELVKQPEQISMTIPIDGAAAPLGSFPDERCCEECGHTPEDGHSESCGFFALDDDED
jgi:hypothetical protein